MKGLSPRQAPRALSKNVQAGIQIQGDNEDHENDMLQLQKSKTMSYSSCNIRDRLSNLDQDIMIADPYGQIRGTVQAERINEGRNTVAHLGDDLILNNHAQMRKQYQKNQEMRNEQLDLYNIEQSFVYKQPPKLVKKTTDMSFQSTGSYQSTGIEQDNLSQITQGNIAKIKIPIKSKEQLQWEKKIQICENQRVVKWRDMLAEYPLKVHSKLKSRGRKGIPNSFRGYAWCLLSEAQINLKVSKGTINANALLKNKKQKSEIVKLMSSLMAAEGNPKFMQEIHKDVSRTLPNHIYFQQKFNHGQKDLFGILKCISIVEPELGYVQGMGYMAAILLTYVDKVDAFCIMLSIINGESYNMKQFYKTDFPGLLASYYIFLQLLDKYMPKLHNHLIEQCFMPPIYATQWFMTIFSTNMPIELTLRIWDIFFIEGKKILYRVALAIFKILEKELLESDFEGLNRKIKEFVGDTSYITPKKKEEEKDEIQKINQKIDEKLHKQQQMESKLDKIIEVANKFTFSKKLIFNLEAEFFSKNHKEEYSQHCLRETLNLD